MVWRSTRKSSRPRLLSSCVFLCCWLCFLCLALPVKAQTPSTADLDRQFQQAVAAYESGHYAESAAILEKLLPAAPQSFELHELLGLDYAGQSQDAKANTYLEKAARLNPKSAEAHTNLAANLSRLGKSAELLGLDFVEPRPIARALIGRLRGGALGGTSLDLDLQWPTVDLQQQLTGVDVGAVPGVASWLVSVRANSSDTDTTRAIAATIAAMPTTHGQRGLLASAPAGSS